jgi:hypothetical protein
MSGFLYVGTITLIFLKGFKYICFLLMGA